MLDERNQEIAVMYISGMAQDISAVAQTVGRELTLPSTIFKPRLFVDGDKWCALYGENIQDGVAGFGKSPVLAMMDFDVKWATKLPEKEAASL